MKAYHFLKADMTTGYGKELPWTVGEERVWKGRLVFCKAGYHYGLTWYDALQNAPGPVACIVDVDPPERPDLTDGCKGASRRRRLDAAYDAACELRLFACDCAERALERERAQGREPDMRSWTAIAVSRRYAWGKVTEEELAAAGAAAGEAAWAAAWDAEDTARAAAWAAARAARAAAWDAAKEAAAWEAWAAEVAWQRGRLAEILDAVVVHPKEVTP